MMKRPLTYLVTVSNTHIHNRIFRGYPPSLQHRAFASAGPRRRHRVCLGSPETTAIMLAVLLLSSGAACGLMFQSHAVSSQWDTWAFVENGTYYAYYLVTEHSPGEGFGVATSPDGQARPPDPNPNLTSPDLS